MKNKIARKEVYNFLEEFSVAIIVVIILFSLVFRVVDVKGISMEPTLQEDDRLVLSCINFDYEQGDIIVITDVLDNPIIKRVIATAGQTVDIDTTTGTVYVDGVALDETEFGLENGITTEVFTSEPRMELPATVPENCVFVLGDNRSNSEDSRFTEVGMIDTRNIMGKAIFRFLPFESFGGF